MKNPILAARLEFLLKELAAEASRSVGKRDQILEWAQALIDEVQRSPLPSRQD